MPFQRVQSMFAWPYALGENIMKGESVLQRRSFTSWQTGSREQGRGWELGITFKSTLPHNGILFSHEEERNVIIRR
jgi:hypothetical protein